MLDAKFGEVEIMVMLKVATKRGKREHRTLNIEYRTENIEARIETSDLRPET